MRTLILLIVAGIVGSIAIGAVTQNTDTTSRHDTWQTLKTLFAGNRPAALRLLERTASSCIPELAQVKSNNGRKLFPRILLARFDTMGRSGDGLTRDEKAQIDREVDQLVRAVPENDFPLTPAPVSPFDSHRLIVVNRALTTSACH